MSQQPHSLEAQLQLAGFDVWRTTPTILGHTQYRYTMRRQKTGEFIAWFCWYAKPAIDRPYNPRLREEGVLEQTLEAKLTADESQLVKRWFEMLHKQHPVASSSHPR